MPAKTKFKEIKEKDGHKDILVAVYIRVSTDEQAQYGFSVEAQKEKAIAFCKSQDWKIFDTYIDNGFKGGNLNRPQIKRLLVDIEKKKFNVILIYKLDRLSRRLSDLTTLVEKFEALGVGIRSITEPFDTTNPTGKLLFNMLGSFAQFERELIGERTQLGIARRVKEGKWTTYPPFVGYNMVDGKLVLNEKEASYYKRAVELFLDNNYGAELIARKLNKEDKITRRAGKWSDSTIWNMLTNPVYCGLLKWRDNIFKGEHQAVISKVVFEEIQERLREKNQVPSGVHSSPNFLNGLIVCGNCNSVLTTAKGKKKYHYYACTGRKKGCSLSYIRTDAIHQTILDQISEVAKNPKIVRDSVDEYNKSHIDQIGKFEKELQLSKRRIAELSKKKDKKIAWITEKLPDKTVTSILSREINNITEQIEELKNRVTQLEVEIDQEKVNKTKAEIIVDFFLHFREMFETMDIYQKRLLIKSVIRNVIVYGKEKIKLVLNPPLNPPKTVAPLTTTELKNPSKNTSGYPSYQSWGG